MVRDSYDSLSSKNRTLKNILRREKIQGAYNLLSRLGMGSPQVGEAHGRSKCFANSHLINEQARRPLPDISAANGALATNFDPSG